MKLSVTKEALLDGLQKVLTVIGTRSPVPVLSNILFAARDGKLYVTATDLDRSVRAVVPARVEREGSTTLPSKFISGIIREAPSDEIELELGANEVTSITAGSALFILRGLSADDFPPLPTMEGGRVVAVEQKLLKTMLLRTGYAASTDESRAILNGVLLRFKAGRLAAVATDGRRLALVEQDVEVAGDFSLDLAVPTKTISELVRSLGDEGEVRIRASANQVVFETDTLSVFSKLLDGTYPNYSQVIPTQAPIRIPLERELFMNAVRRVALMTSERSNSVKLSFGRNRLEILAASADVGEARETMPVKYDGESISIAFNPALLTEPLKYLAADEVFLEISTPTSPGVLKTDEPFLYVIMPMMIS